eukprot:scaffold1401_cov180-Ochromonas_danica.AAC.5
MEELIVMDLRKAIDDLDLLLPYEKVKSGGNGVNSGGSQSRKYSLLDLLQTIIISASSRHCDEEVVATGSSPSQVIQLYCTSLLIPAMQMIDSLLSTTAPSSDGERKGSNGGTGGSQAMVSINHVRVLYTALELLWVFGIQPTLDKASAFTLPSSRLPNAMVIPPDALVELDGKPLMPVDSMVTFVSRVDLFHHLICNDMIASMVLPRNFGRLLLACYVFLEKASKNETITTRYQALLNELVATDKYKMMLVSKLRSFTSGPVWLRKMASETLRQVLESSGGVQAVFSGYLDGMAGSPHWASMQVQVARMIAAQPRSQSPRSYYTLLAPQVQEIFTGGIEGKDSGLLSNGVTLVHAMLMSQTELTTELVLSPMLHPLVQVIETRKVDHARLDESIRSLEAMLIMVPMASPDTLLKALYKLRIPQAMLHLMTLKLNEKSAFLKVVSSSDKENEVDMKSLLCSLLCGWPEQGECVVLAFLDHSHHANTAQGISAGAGEQLVNLRTDTPLQLLAAIKQDEQEESMTIKHRVDVLLSLMSRDSPAAAMSTLLSGIIVQLLRRVFHFEFNSNASISAQVLDVLLQHPAAVEAVIQCDGFRAVELLGTVLERCAEGLETVDEEDHTEEVNTEVKKSSTSKLIQEISVNDLDMSEKDSKREKNILSSQSVDMMELVMNILAVLVSSQQLWLQGLEEGQDKAHHSHLKPLSSALLPVDMKKALLSLLPSLQGILLKVESREQCEGNNMETRWGDMIKTITDLSMAIMHLCATVPLSSSSEEVSSESTLSFAGQIRGICRETHLQEAINTNTEDGDIVVFAAFGVKQITKLINSTTQKIVNDHLSLLLTTLLPLLPSNDSYLHLTVIEALVKLCAKARSFSSLAVLVLCFGGDEAEIVYGKEQLLKLSSSYSAGAGDTSSVNTPCVEGDVLIKLGLDLPLILRNKMRTARFRTFCCAAIERVLHLPGIWPSWMRYMAQGLIALCIRIARRRLGSEAKEEFVDISTGRLKSSPTVCQDNSQLDKEKMEREGSEADDLYLRQSALSLLGQALVYMQQLPVYQDQKGEGCAVSVAAENYLQDVLLVALGVLQMESANSPAHIAARRSAIFLLRYLIEHHHELLFDGREEHYHFLKLMLRQSKQSAASDKDERVRNQALRTMEALHHYTVSYLGLDNFMQGD